MTGFKEKLPEADFDLVEKALQTCIDCHREQKRSSGEPYFTHPIAVAKILVDMQLDPASIITALLHDTVEDTDMTLEQLEKDFGKEIASLVDGVTKLTRIELQSIETKQAENFRKLVLAMSEDIRVLLVKLADRTHNMSTLGHISKPHKRRRIATETIEIFAPLAERIGVHQIKELLEDMSFAHLQPEARESILKRLSYLREEDNNLVDQVMSVLRKDMKDAGIESKISGREKTVYSIWRKMQRKNVAFEQLSDIMAFRIVVDTIGDCYHVLGVLHGLYPVVPGRFKDYISTPKLNGYRSLHTTVLGPENQKVEIQIRTEEMHQEAELGVAAHWSYKQGQKKAQVKDAQQYRWLRELLDILENAGQPDEFLENTKLELFQDRVFCFSPRGDLIELPNGATPIDFAYAVHSDVGDTCVGAKINGRIAPLNTKLQNGDQVEIQTSKTQTPSPTWERFVVTGKAKSRIRRFIRQQQRDEYMQLGKAMLEKKFRQEGYKFTEKAVLGVLKIFKLDMAEDLYAGIGSGHITAKDVFGAIFPDHKKSIQTPSSTDPGIEASIEKRANRIAKNTPNKDGVPIKGLIPGMAVHFARCCHPLPGDRIVGIVTTGKGVTIHTIDCETLETFADTPERWIDVSWDAGPDKPETHIARIGITIGNEAGALGTLSTVIGKNGGNITNLKIVNRNTDFWDMHLDIYVEDVIHLNNIIAALRATPEVISVDRYRGR
ncbi:MAG: bifunctional (p)ppGpp synthetase/guanosine-3',5'-bis(diphosphate) 3'-pyrophosphohydrolase [Rickettsiales bacterium]|nr:bifunctional (p)ppGpp synthetase/guanosine-3',5'-bis(diphosphate) 3'-pyrophosphohydrolase [Rickettsiales bacterium]